MNIYVGNLDFKVDGNDLRIIFEEYGAVSEVKIIKDRYSEQSKGFGFVTMDNSVEAKKAIKELNGATFDDRNLMVNEAREKSEAKNRSTNRRRY